ncbi:MAG: ammonia-forming cytochrome c nitrite reductase subunit c552 [Anaerolineae bacterium]|nr:ammonia-forming cytochrome c nitrite reductase subunit c552 [Anaerolineae bacterium]
MRAMQLLLITGILLLTLGFALTVLAQEASEPAAPQTETPPADAEYVGSDSCFKCHSSFHRDWSNTLHARMIQNPVENPTAVLADFASGDGMRMTRIGNETRPYTLNDVAYTMGSRYRQRYIMQTEDGMMVLPGQWSIEDQAWVEAEPEDWLKDCAGCHTTGFDVESLTYSELNITCEACHGPGSAHVEAAEALEIGATDEAIYQVRQQIVETVDATLCGSCHSLGTSPDGEHAYPVGYVVGGPLDETMIVRVEPTGTADDPFFWPDGTAKHYRMQYLEWSGSAHATANRTIQESDHGDAICISCHSTDFSHQDNLFPQDAVTVENAQFGVTCVQCHDPHGSAGVENQLAGESYDLCIGCHTDVEGDTVISIGSTVHHAMREMFEGRPFLGMDANPSPHFAETDGPVCASCHMVETGSSDGIGQIATHTFQVILPTENAEGQPDSCTGCHTQQSGASPEDLYFYIKDVQSETQDLVEEIRDKVQRVYEDEHWDAVAEEKTDAQLLADQILTLLSFIEADGSWGIHNPNYTQTILDETEDLLDDLYVETA